jgi:hypothetical protein
MSQEAIGVRRFYSNYIGQVGPSPFLQPETRNPKPET